MSCNWQLKELDQVITKRNQGVNTTTEKVKYSDDGVIVVRANNITQGNIDFKDVAFVDKETFKRIKEPCKPRKGDVLYTNIGSQFGNAAKVEVNYDFVIAWNVLRLQPNQETDADFLVYLLNNPSNKAYIQSLNSSSTMPFVSGKEIGKTSFNFPDLQIQRKIGNWLKSLDNKIYLNTQTNQTLEQMAQAIFKSWFVDFDPVKAKMNGEQPEGMDAATASLFPEKLVESELGLIPEGWDAVKVGDIVQRLKPKKRYTKKQVEPYGKTPVYEQGASILLGFHNDDAGFDASPEDPVFIFGDHTCITHLSCSKFDISSNVIPLKGSVRPTIWTYYAIQGKQEFQEYRRHWSEFIIKDIVLPPVELAEKYAELVTTKYLMMESLKRQSKELEQLRDTLLPKLLSGEIEL
ncbi:restriction endonuclease subunit S, partial [Photobacterium damselae]|uniref:restriction endonuclease subunit S n=1 Tax=Photobacterium damselae TaxID=38293 RepID=UPI001EFDDEC2